MAEIREAVSELFDPDERALRVPREQAAAMFLGLLFSRARPQAVSALTTAQLVDTFLYGAVSSGEPRESREPGGSLGPGEAQ